MPHTATPETLLCPRNFSVHYRGLEPGLKALGQHLANTFADHHAAIPTTTIKITVTAIIAGLRTFFQRPQRLENKNGGFTYLLVGPAESHPHPRERIHYISEREDRRLEVWIGGWDAISRETIL